MSEFSGTLHIFNDISRLNGDVLLRTGIPDETQAKSAATSFLEEERDLHDGDPAVVTGVRASPGKIRMSNARAASTDEFVASGEGKQRKKAAFAAKTEGLPKRKKGRVRGKSKKSNAED
ncbi:MAG TPA: hypothetical protein VIT88_04065 [Pyrinomonadaceae bacterium]